MVTDTIISALTNLFALFCSRGKVDVDVSKQMLADYLGRHFGIRNRDEYLDLYTDLCGFYLEMPDLDTDEIVDGICTGLKSEIRQEEGAMVLLRLMEFCAKTPEFFDPQDKIFSRSANNLGIDETLCHLFADFVMNKESQEVKLTLFDGFAAPVKTLWLKSMNTMVFSYDGDDALHVRFNDVPLVKGMYQVWDTSGVLKHQFGKPVYYSMIQALYQSTHSGKDIIFSGRDINFRFPNSDNGMHDFSFDMRNGELIAIMGGSGSGKTTLVSILNGNIKPQSGSITINGHSIDEPEAKALVGFVPQDDLLIEELTVYQNLYYTAKLCFEGMTEEEIDQRVMRTLKDLGLEQAKDLKVGSPINKYISGGQRKRLNIALELIREPAVLFLDEPTSGLSSADTEKVILLLKEQTFHGRLVVTNIHQPSSDVYKLFDRLWLLDRGGYPVFDGNPIEAITYFKTAANYADADASTCPVCGNVNPEVVLNIIEEKALDSRGSLSDERKVSPKRWHQMYLDARPKMDEPKVEEVPVTEQKKPNVLKQWYIFMKRNVMTKITNAQYLAITLLEAPLLAGVCALLTHYSPAEQDYSILENKNLVSYLFMAIIVATFIGMSGSAEEIIKDRALLKREKFLQLSYNSYIWSKIVLMAGVSLLQTLLFVVVGNWVMGISDQFFVWWGIMLVTATLANLTGLVLSQCLSSVVAIYITIPILLIPQILLCGLVVNFNDLTPDSKTGNVPAIGNVIPSRWAYEALAVTSYTNNDYERDLFVYDKEKYETQYYRYGFIYELQSAMEKREENRKMGKEENPEHLLLLKTELPTVAEICEMKPYNGKYDYQSLHDYLDDAEQVMKKRGNTATLTADRMLLDIKQKHEEDYLQQLKRNHFNLQLESQLAGHDAKKLCEVVEGHIVPRAGFVYLTPRTTNGNAPFYSSVKRIGTLTIPTLWFNMAVMLIMAAIVTICLLFEIPARWVNKN
ncbi:MAG: ATP-binding cassette domain-containing protein [Prevotella sp.]|nr:ATP-binding cassette domain-containing protein [Candidatus Prevotella equi]